MAAAVAAFSACVALICAVITEVGSAGVAFTVGWNASAVGLVAALVALRRHRKVALVALIGNAALFACFVWFGLGLLGLE